MPPRKPQSALPPWKRSLFRVLAIVLPLLAMEAAARVYWVQFVEPPKTDEALFESVIGEKVLGDEVPYQFFPNREFVVASTPTRTNNLRLRGDYDVDTDSAFGGTRILCVGDSVTFGYCVSGNQTAYPAVLERILADRGIDCQVLNGGMPRFRIEHLAILFTDQLQHYKSDLVVILGGWNNANDHVLRPIPHFSLSSAVRRHWYMLRVVEHWDLLPRRGGRFHAPAKIESAGLRRYADALQNLIALARASGARPVLCTLPHFFHHTESKSAQEKAATFTPVGTLEQLAEAADAMNEQIRSVAAETNTPLIDLMAIDRDELFGDAIHPNDDGSQQIAELVAEALSRLGLLDSE